MVDLTFAALVTLVLNKGFEEVGKNLGAKTLEQGGKLAKMFRGKLSPRAVGVIEQGDSSREEHQQAILEAEVVAQSDPEVAQVIQSVREAMQAQPHGQQILNTWIEKVGNVYNAPVTIGKQEFNF